MEDDEDDTLLLTRVIARLDPGITVHSVRDAERAIAYLESRSPYENKGCYPRPGMIFLDLRLPGMSGVQFLQWKAGSAYAAIPVIVFSGSVDLREHNRAMAEGAVRVCGKPLGIEELTQAVSGVLSLGVPAPGERNEHGQGIG